MVHGDHPLVAHKLTTLRDARTDSPTFRRLADELVTLLADAGVVGEGVPDGAPKAADLPDTPRGRDSVPRDVTSETGIVPSAT